MMIQNEAEYKSTVLRAREQEQRLKQQAAELKRTGLSKEQIKRVTDPLRAFHEQFKEEVESYEPEFGLSDEVQGCGEEL